MNEIVPLDQLATEIRYYSQQASWSIIEVGKRLIEAKKQVAHGEWADWLKNNVYFGKSTAANFMQCAERFSNFQSIGNLNPTQIIALLSLPEAETETFIEQKKAEGKPVEDMTVKTLRDEIKKWKGKADQAEHENATLTEQYNAQAQEIAGYKDTIRRQADEIANGDSEELAKEKQKRIEAEQQIAWLKQNPPEPKDYRANKRRIEELERDVATYKAHEEGLTLQQKAMIDAEVAKYKNTASEEIHKSMRIMDLVNAVMNLPKNMEIADYAESHIRQSVGAEARAKAEIEKVIIDLQVIHDELDKYIHKERKLQVVK